MIWGWLIPGWIKRAAIGAAALALAVLAAFGAGKREGRIGSRAKAAEDAAKRSEKGGRAATKAKAQIDAGAKPDDVVRKNDEGWR